MILALVGAFLAGIACLATMFPKQLRTQPS
jgi:hypothetical protein